MEPLFLSADNTKHFAWYDTQEVSFGTREDHDAKSFPRHFVIQPFKGRSIKIQDLASISSNDSLHFAWYIERIPKGDPEYFLWVCAGPITALGAKRDWYLSQLPHGANPDNLLWITSNNKMHFAWFKKGPELWVGRGVSEDLDKHDIHRCQLPPDVAIDHILYMASNDKRHYAFLKNSTCLVGSSDKLDHTRPIAKYDLLEMKDLVKY